MINRKMLGIYLITNNNSGKYYIDDNMIPEGNTNYTIEILKICKDQEELDLTKEWYDKYMITTICKWWYKRM